MSSWSSYPSIFAMGHKAIADLLNHDVNCEEKVDGSQFSFGLVEANLDAEGRPVDAVDDEIDHKPYSLKVRSKGAVMTVDAPQAMFRSACETVKTLFNKDLLHPGWTYRGEVLAKPHHNALAYERVPKGNIIIFDVNTGNQEYLSYVEKAKECHRLGLEIVPLLYSGRVENVGAFRAFFDRTSILGGQNIEGVVVKPQAYNLFGLDKKVLLGKFVSEAFKEVHRKSWGEANPSNKDIITRIVGDYASPARWAKALIHLREEGKIEGSPRDIGALIKAVPIDVLKECEDEIKDRLFKYAWDHIKRGITKGLPAWYKDVLLEAQFEKETEHGTQEEL